MRVFILFILIFASFGCSSEKKADDGGWDVVIKGKVNFPQQGTIQIQELKMNGQSAQPEVIELKKDNTFYKTLHLTEPGVFGINFFGKQVVNLMVYQSTIDLTVAGNDPQGFVEIKGSPDHELWQKVQTMYQASQNTPELKKIEMEFQAAATAKDEKKMDELRAAYMKQLEVEQNKIVELLRQQPASLALYNLLQDPNLIDKDKHLDLFIAAAEKFKKNWPTFHYTQEFADVVNKLKVTAIGQVAPEIALANPDGQIVKLSSLRGKYVLIDFWAKWCGPCRKENPNVVKAYHRFKEKGFEVYSVSLDKNKADWLQAIQEDGLVWTHVSDLKYFDCQAAHDYNINAIPFSILLDKDGVILAKNLRGSALEQKLEQVLGK
jgi:peroxiredoxin